MQDIRARFGLPAQMACSAPRQVGATYKTLWTKVKANAAARAAGQTKKRYQRLGPAPQVRLAHADLSTRARLWLQDRPAGEHPDVGGARDPALHGLRSPRGTHPARRARIGAAKLWYDKPRKQFYLLVSLEVEVADPTPRDTISASSG